MNINEKSIKDKMWFAIDYNKNVSHYGDSERDL